MPARQKWLNKMPLPSSFFREGQKYRARVIAAGEEQHFYRLEVAGNFITAFSASELKIGESVFLEVVKSGEQPQLRIIRQQQEKSAAEKLLFSCRLPLTEENVLLMQKYLSEGKPVQFNEITAYFKSVQKKS